MIELLLALASPAHAAPPPEPASPPAAPEELPVVENPSILEYVDAVYPPEAQAQGLEAVVKLRITLTDAGGVDNVEVVEPQGHGFDEAAVDAVLAMKWSPAKTTAGPVAVVFDFDYHFVLNAAPEPEPVAVEAPIDLEGTILEMATRVPLVGVTVGVDGTDLVAVTDDQGQFSIRGVPPGTALVRLRDPGHVEEERSIEIVAGQVTTVKLWMRAESYRDNEVVATYDREKDEVTRRTISISEVRRVPGTFGDPVRVIQTLPGAARTPFGTGLLVIRGADPEDSGVYIDGIRVPIIYHLTGTTSVLSPDLIESVDYLPGGYGVQYGRTMGGTVDVHTKSQFDEHGKFVWGTDILDSQLYYEGRVGKNKASGIAFGARRSYVDLFIPIFTGQSGFVLKPRYWDYQIKWATHTAHGDELSAFVYGFDDVLKAGTPADVAQGSDQDTQGDLEIGYSSHRAMFRWLHPFSDRTHLELIPSFGIDGTNSKLGDAFGLRSTQLIPQLRAELVKPIPELEFQPGLDALSGFWKFDFLSAVNFASIGDPLAERESVAFSGQGTFWSPDPYVRVNLRPLEHGSNRWLVSAGVRGSTLILHANGDIAGANPSTTTDLAFDPRILTRFEVVPDKFAIKGATGIYHQPPQPQESIGVGTKATTSFERAWSNSVGWEHRLNKALSYDVDVFYRRMDDLIVLSDAFTGFGTNPYFNGGSGRAYGLEVIARHDPVDRLFGWVSYTLSRASRLDPGACDAKKPANGLLGSGGCWYLFDFDQTHIFSAQAGYDLPFDLSVSAQVQFVTGNPSSEYDTAIYDVDNNTYTPFQIGTYNDARLPPYFQTSLRVDKLWTFRKWQLDSYVDLLNAVRGVNPEFTVYNYDYTQSAYIRGLPFIPNIGIEAKDLPMTDCPGGFAPSGPPPGAVPLDPVSEKDRPGAEDGAPPRDPSNPPFGAEAS